MTSSESISWLNYIRFLLEKCSAKTSHEDFRIWIVCASVESYLALAPLSVPTNCIAMEELRRVRKIDDDSGRGHTQEKEGIIMLRYCVFSKTTSNLV